MRQWLTLAGVLLALAVVGVGWSADQTISSSDIVAADGGGGNVLAAGKGEDLLCGSFSPDHYPWPSAAGAISVQVTSNSDTGWVVAEGLTITGVERADSVRITGAGVYALSGTWWRVNDAYFRDNVANDGSINVFAGVTTAVTAMLPLPPSTLPLLATIPPRQSHSCPDHYTLPAGKKQVIPKSWRVTAVSVFASADSSAVGVVAVLGREYGGNWSILDRLAWSTVSGPVDHPYPPTQWDLGPLADLVVPASPTGGETMIDSRLQFETR